MLFEGAGDLLIQVACLGVAVKYLADRVGKVETKVENTSGTLTGMQVDMGRMDERLKRIEGHVNGGCIGGD